MVIRYISLQTLYAHVMKLANLTIVLFKASIMSEFIELIFCFLKIIMAISGNFT